MSQQSGVSACEPSPISCRALQQRVSEFFAQSKCYDIQLAVGLWCCMHLGLNAWAHRCRPEALRNVEKHAPTAEQTPLAMFMCSVLLIKHAFIGLLCLPQDMGCNMAQCACRRRKMG